MKKLKDVLFSQRGMTVANVLFLLATLYTFYGPAKSVLLFFAYFAWLAYLVFCLKNSDSKGSKVTFAVIIGVVIVLICVNIFLLIRR